MGDKGITRDELLAEVAAFLIAQQDPRPGDDWFLTMEIVAKVQETNPELKYDKVHKMVNTSAWERRRVGSKWYYRKISEI
jgi:hypothetical protein